MRTARWTLIVLSLLLLTGCPKKTGYLRVATLQIDYTTGVIGSATAPSTVAKSAPLADGHCARNAVAGSIRAARTAGIQQAPIPTVAMSAITPTNVSGS